MRCVRSAAVFAAAASALILVPAVSTADTFFVDPAGDNTNPGSAAAPWATLQFAANQVGPGDTVNVNPGDYVGFQLAASGTPGNPITFAGRPGVRITQPNASTPDGINLEAVSHAVVTGFDIQGMPRAGIRSVGLLNQFASHVALTHNRAADNGRWGIFTGFVDDLRIERNVTSGSVDEHGIYVSNSGDRPIVRGNVGFGNADAGVQLNADGTLGGDGVISNALIENNRFFDNGTSGGSAINLDGVQDSVIRNNLLYNNHASGISLFRIDGSEPSTNNLVAHNTIHQPADGRWALNIQNASTGNTVLNNIFVTEHPFRGAIDIAADALPGLVSDYNALAPRFTADGGDSALDLTQWQAQTGQDTNSFAADAASLLFVAFGGEKYRHLPGAPVVDAGAPDALIQALNLGGLPTTDRDGLPRPLGDAVDIGTYETPALRADADLGAQVEQADLDAVLQNWGDNARFAPVPGTAPVGWPTGDYDGDGLVDQSDLDAVLQTWGTQPPAAARVPEPGGALALSAPAAIAAGRRRSGVPRVALLCAPDDRPTRTTLVGG